MACGSSRAGGRKLRTPARKGQKLGSSGPRVVTTVLRAHGMRFVIYLNDHEPAHVHAITGSGEAKINLLGSAEVVYATGMTRAEIRKALDVVRISRLHFLSEWRRIHG